MLAIVLVNPLPGIILAFFGIFAYHDGTVIRVQGLVARVQYSYCGSKAPIMLVKARAALPISNPELILKDPFKKVTLQLQAAKLNRLLPVKQSAKLVISMRKYGLVKSLLLLTNPNSLKNLVLELTQSIYV
jgi:hypothetical protein